MVFCVLATEWKNSRRRLLLLLLLSLPPASNTDANDRHRPRHRPRSSTRHQPDICPSSTTSSVLVSRCGIWWFGLFMSHVPFENFIPSKKDEKSHYILLSIHSVFSFQASKYCFFWCFWRFVLFHLVSRVFCKEALTYINQKGLNEFERIEWIFKKEDWMRWILILDR